MWLANAHRLDGAAIAVLATLVVAIGGRPAHAEISPIVTTTISEFDALTFDDPFSLTLAAAGGTPPYTWSIAASGSLPAGLALTPHGVIGGRPSAGGAAYRFTVRATDALGSSGTRAFDVRVYPVPKPKPIAIPYTLSTIYMPKPSWPSFTWGFLRTHNERNAVKHTKGQRMPLLGYYQGDSPEVLDWQIKMAVDHGITNFMFDDYWVDNVDHPILDTSSKAFLASRYGDQMSFAMLYNYCLTPENDASELKACFLDKVLPFYVSQYFSRPNYLKIDGRPVIQLLHAGLATGLWLPADIQGFLDEADAYIAAHSSYPGAYWIASDTLGAPYDPGGTIHFENVALAGFDAVAPYYVLPYVWPDTSLWGPPILWGNFPIRIPDCAPPDPPNCNRTGNFKWLPGLPYSGASDSVVEASIDRHARGFEAAAAIPAPLPAVKFIPSIATDFDSRATYWSRNQLYYNGQNDADYAYLLGEVKDQVDVHLDLVPTSSNTGKPLVGLGAWNEQQESSSIEPGYSEFQWPDSANRDPWSIATAAAMAFGGPSAYERYTPPDLGRGFPAKSDWTFSTATGAGLDEWNTMATAGLAIGPGDVLQVAGAGRLLLTTPTFVDAASFGTVKVLVRVDEGISRLENVVLFAQSSDYSATAHLFGEPPEHGRQFYPLRMRVPPGKPDLDGFRTLTFDVSSHPDRWKGTVKYLELRFEVKACSEVPAPCPRARYSLKRVWME